VVDIKPTNMDELNEVITSAAFHPHHCNMMMYSSSRGAIRLADMREAALCERYAKGEHTFQLPTSTLLLQLPATVATLLGKIPLRPP
jgi:serine/threonine-protein phosphatase 2A regulatory subunit B